MAVCFGEGCQEGGVCGYSNNQDKRSKPFPHLGSRPLVQLRGSHFYLLLMLLLFCDVSKRAALAAAMGSMKACETIAQSGGEGRKSNRHRRQSRRIEILLWTKWASREHRSPAEVSFEETALHTDLGTGEPFLCTECCSRGYHPNFLRENTGNSS